jgi:hypothetical protein
MPIIGNEKGSSLLISLMVLCLLTLLGTAALMVSTTDSKITHHMRKFEQAFYAADAGSQMARSIDPETVEPGQTIDSTGTFLDTAKYEVTFLDNLPLNWGIYILNIQSEGQNAAGSAKRTIRVDVQRVERSTGPVNDYTYQDDYSHGSQSSSATGANEEESSAEEEV